MNKELLLALEMLEKEKNISKEILLEAIENSLLTACKNHFGKADNVKVIMDRQTCDYKLYAEKTVVEDVDDPVEQISIEDARNIDGKYDIGDIVQIPIESKSFGRIATQNAKNLILQKIREEERKVVYDQYFEKEKDIVRLADYLGHSSVETTRRYTMTSQIEKCRQTLEMGMAAVQNAGRLCGHKRKNKRKKAL